MTDTQKTTAHILIVIFLIILATSLIFSGNNKETYEQKDNIQILTENLADKMRTARDTQAILLRADSALQDAIDLNNSAIDQYNSAVDSLNIYQGFTSDNNK